MQATARENTIPIRTSLGNTRASATSLATFRQLRCISFALFCMAIAAICPAQQFQDDSPPSRESTDQIHVSWIYGSYVPKDVPLEPLDAQMRFKLYLRQTYTTPGIYAKTLLFASRDQIAGSNPEWGDGFSGFAKRLGNRQAQFIVQNSISALGNGIVGWEPRYDRCRCDDFWLRTRHAVIRNFVTYDHTEKSLRPKIMSYLGAFGASSIATTWEPGNPSWQIRAYQAVVTQVFVGAGINWLSEFAPDIGRILRRKNNKVASP